MNKISDEDINILNALEEIETGKWLDSENDRNLKYLDITNDLISIKDFSFIKEDPELMLRAIRLSGEIITDIDDNTLETIKANQDFLKNTPRNRLKEHFEGILTSNDAQKALSYLRKTGLLIYMFGDPIYKSASNRTVQDIDIIIENINQARPEPEHRWTLILYPMGKDKSEQALRHMIMDDIFISKVTQAIKLVDKLYFLNTKIELKRFIKKYGYENYIFIDKIARQLKKIFDRTDYKVESRYFMLEEAKNCNEPLTVEDLNITSYDLIKNGYTGENDADKMMSMLLDLTITKPKLNTKEQLLKEASRLSKNPIYRKMTKIRWLR